MPHTNNAPGSYTFQCPKSKCKYIRPDLYWTEDSSKLGGEYIFAWCVSYAKWRKAKGSSLITGSDVWIVNVSLLAMITWSIRWMHKTVNLSHNQNWTRKRLSYLIRQKATGKSGGIYSGSQRRTHGRITDCKTQLLISVQVVHQFSETWRYLIYLCMNNRQNNLTIPSKDKCWYIMRWTLRLIIDSPLWNRLGPSLCYYGPREKSTRFRRLFHSPTLMTKTMWLTTTDW